MGKRLDRLRAKHAAELEPSTVSMTYPPGSPPEYGTRQLTLGEHVNWNQFGPKGTEHNWKDQSRKGTGPRPRPEAPVVDPNQGAMF